MALSFFCRSSHAARRRLYDSYDALHHVEFHQRSARDFRARALGIPIENGRETDMVYIHVGYYRSQHVDGRGDTVAGRIIGEVGGGIARSGGRTDGCPVLVHINKYSASGSSAEPHSRIISLTSGMKFRGKILPAMDFVPRDDEIIPRRLRDALWMDFATPL